MAEDKPTPGDMAAFGASDEACYRWPGDSASQRDCRSAFCDGAGWAADTIESLRAQLATSHALGFKAGIEAAVADIQNHMDNLGHQSAFAIEAKYNKIFDYSVNAWGVVRDIRNSVTSLHTPPSPLPEILEAMRPIAEIVAKDISSDERDDGLFSDRLTHNQVPRLTVGHLRAIAAVFAKHGWKL